VQATHAADRPLGSSQWVLIAIALVGLGYTLVRFGFGIGSIANVNQAYPWGWWVGFGVLSMIAFGATGFTMALVVDVFGVQKYAPLLRPAILIGFLFYNGYAIILMIELGRPWMGWLIFLSWAPTSALFEVAWCATLYTACLVVELGKVATKHYGWTRLFRVIGWIYLPVVILGVSLSHVHQMTLGTLLTIVPLKVDPRWWSELLPPLFLVSAYSAGFAMISIEHVLATRFLRRVPRPDLLAGLARWQVVLLSIYLVLRIGDLASRGSADLALRLDWLSFSLWVEIVAGFVVPLVLFSLPEVRQSLWGLFSASCLVAGGVLLNRLNVAVISMQVKHWQTYFPSVGEFMTTFGVVAAGVLLFVWAIRNLPIHSEAPLPGTEVAS
jgi:formate dehydrogenase iron-sulfur subunit